MRVVVGADVGDDAFDTGAVVVLSDLGAGKVSS